MRKTLLFVLLLIFSVSTLSAIEITGFGAYNMYLNDTADLEGLSTGGLGGGIRLGYDLPLITLGLMVEYLPTLSYSVKYPAVGNISAYVQEDESTTLPIIGFIRTGLGPLPFYLIGGAGMYYNTKKTIITPTNKKNITETSVSSSEFGFALGGGFEFTLIPLLTLEAGVLYHSIMVDPESISMLTLTAGVTLTI